MIATDVYIEQVFIPEGTPEQMAQFFVDTTNSSYLEDRTGYSRQENDIRKVQLTDSWLLKIGGREFVILQWNCMKNREEEED